MAALPRQPLAAPGFLLLQASQAHGGARRRSGATHSGTIRPLLSSPPLPPECCLAPCLTQSSQISSTRELTTRNGDPIDCSICLLCFSLADRETFDGLDEWHRAITAKLPAAQILLVGTKSDLPGQVSHKEAYHKGRTLGGLYVETSATVGAAAPKPFLLAASMRYDNSQHQPSH